MEMSAKPKKQLGMRYVYSRLGKPARAVMTDPLVTAIVGAYMDTKCSARHIDRFIENNEIDMSEYEVAQYSCFNDFFTREIKHEMRPVNHDPDVLISPCDGQLSAYMIDADSEFAIKNSYYSVSDLVGGDEIAHEYLNGTCLVLRLGVENYHRYCYIDEGFKGPNHHIKGRYHPVQPIVVRRHPVFRQNTREYSMLYTENFGDVIQIEIGACMVGKIKNHQETAVIHRGAEKGMFLFGGSTIVLLFKEGVLDIPDWVFGFTLMGREIPVKYGAQIAKKAVRETAETE